MISRLHAFHRTYSCILLHVVGSLYGVPTKLTNDHENISVSPKLLSTELHYHSDYYFESLIILYDDFNDNLYWFRINSTCRIYRKCYYLGLDKVVRSRVQMFPAWHTKAAPNGKCCEGYIVPSMVGLMYQLKSVLK